MITPTQLAEWRKLAEETSPHNWSDKNLLRLARCHAALPALLDEVEQLRAALVEAERALSTSPATYEYILPEIRKALGAP